MVDGPLFLRSLCVTGARNPRCHSTHSHRDPRSDGLTILCGRWRAIESGQPGSGHSAWGFPEQRPRKPRCRSDDPTNGSLRKRTDCSNEPPGRCAEDAQLLGLPGSDPSGQRTASLSPDPLGSLDSHQGCKTLQRDMGWASLEGSESAVGIPKGVTRERHIGCARNLI